MLANLFLGILFGSMISISSYKLNLLSITGAVSTFVLAFIIFGLGQYKWTIPILSFFIFSSVISKVRKLINPSADKYSVRKGKRDHIQVFANGGIPVILILIYQLQSSELIYIAYVSAIAAVCSDTWSTEIGTMVKTKTINIFNLQEIEQGLSGGVSINGFLGAVIGSFLITVSAIPWLNNLSVVMLIIFLSGILGSLIDSILGASIQAKYKCNICGDITETLIHCGEKTYKKSGVKWINNDVVNFAASSFGALVPILISMLIL